MSSPVSCRGARLTIWRGGAGASIHLDIFRFHMLLNENVDELRGGSVEVLTVERFWG
jgi:hypothetical protein